MMQINVLDGEQNKIVRQIIIPMDCQSDIDEALRYMRDIMLAGLSFQTYFPQEVEK